MEFDQLTESLSEDGVKIGYGIIVGSPRIALIKAGKGSDFCGYENKYLKMAHRIHEKHGYTVICSSNPADCKNSMMTDRSVLLDYCREHGMSDCEITLIGNSDGARQGLLYAMEYAEIKTLLLINMPLMINFHKTKAALKLLTDRNITFVYGSHDPSYAYLPFLKNLRVPNCKIVTIPNADHLFTGMETEFLALSDLLF